MSQAFKTWLTDGYDVGLVVDGWNEDEEDLYEAILHARRFPRFSSSPAIGADYIRRILGATPEQVGIFLYWWKLFYRHQYLNGHLVDCDMPTRKVWGRALRKAEGLERRYPLPFKYEIHIDGEVLPSSVETSAEERIRRDETVRVSQEVHGR